MVAADKLAVFRELHASGCFVVPNPWDRGTVRFLAGLPRSPHRVQRWRSRARVPILSPRSNSEMTRSVKGMLVVVVSRAG